VSADCKYVARVKADQSEFPALWEVAKEYAGSSARWVEVQPGYLAFHFEAQLAHLRFCQEVARRNLKLIVPTSQKLHVCRELVLEDAFEAQDALHMVVPLLKDVLRELKLEYLRSSSTFLRRALTRYLALVLSRLLEKPNERGKSGVTASISSLLAMAKSEAILKEDEIQKFVSDFEKIKADAADREYDLVQVLREMRDTQVAHTLIPWKEPTDQLLAHHIVDFAEAVFDLVLNIEAALAEATGVALKDVRKDAQSFGDDAGHFWRALVSMK
jgi:hypothetical protein